MTSFYFLWNFTLFPNKSIILQEGIMYNEQEKRDYSIVLGCESFVEQRVKWKAISTNYIFIRACKQIAWTRYITLREGNSKSHEFRRLLKFSKPNTNKMRKSYGISIIVLLFATPHQKKKAVYKTLSLWCFKTKNCHQILINQCVLL